MKPKTISLGRFAIYNIISLGMYEVYWAWKAWETVRRSQGINAYKIRSSIRGLFLVFSSIALFPYVRDLAAKKGLIFSATAIRFLAVGFLLVNLVLSRTDNMPLWLFAVTACIETAVLLPVVRLHNYYVEKTAGKYTPGAVNWPLIILLAILAVSTIVAVTILPGVRLAGIH